MESSSSSYVSLVSLPLEAHNFKLLSSDFSQNVGNFGENARVGCDAMRVFKGSDRGEELVEGREIWNDFKRRNRITEDRELKAQSNRRTGLLIGPLLHRATLLVPNLHARRAEPIWNLNRK